MDSALVNKLSNLQSCAAWALFKTVSENAKNTEQAMKVLADLVDFYEEHEEFSDMENDLNKKMDAHFSAENKAYLSDFSKTKDAFLVTLKDGKATLDSIKEFSNALDEVYKIRGAVLKKEPKLIADNKHFFLLLDNMQEGLKKAHF